METGTNQMLQAVGPLLVLLIATWVFKHSVSWERKVSVRMPAFRLSYRKSGMCLSRCVLVDFGNC